jgi:N-acyl amino acid synthase of PEP-CTERM/exosortase system
VIRRFDGERHSICEFSRLAVDGAFRRRAGEAATRFGEVSSLDFSAREQRTFPLIAISTILAALAMSELIERPNCFAMMEPSLPRLLQRSGFIVHPAGEETDYHGRRCPYRFEVREVIAGMANEMREFYAAVHQSFKAGEYLSAGCQDKSGRLAEVAGMKWLKISNCRESGLRLAACSDKRGA